MDLDTPTTVAPASRNAFVTELPRPPLAPVMIATFRSSSGTSGSLLTGSPCDAELRKQRQPAAGEKGLARNVGRLVGSEECEDCGDLGRVAGPAHRNMALHF